MQVETMVQKLKQLRILHGMSQAELGAIVNKTRALVSLWEQGKRYPSLEDLLILSQYFNISLDDLFTKKIERK